MTDRVQCPECGGTTDCSGNDACRHFQDASSNRVPITREDEQRALDKGMAEERAKGWRFKPERSAEEDNGDRCDNCEGTGVHYHMSEFPDRCGECNGSGRDPRETRCKARTWSPISGVGVQCERQAGHAGRHETFAHGWAT